MSAEHSGSRRSSGSEFQTVAPSTTNVLFKSTHEERLLNLLYHNGYATDS